MNKNKGKIIVVIAVILLIVAGILAWKYIFSKEARLKKLRHKLALATTDTEREDFQKKIDALEEKVKEGGEKGGETIGGEKGKENLESAKTNLGSNRKDTENATTVTIAKDLRQKYIVSFFGNGRISINTDKGSIMMGTYSNGGKKIVIDNKYGGYLAESNFVFNNISSVIKQWESANPKK